MLCQQKILLFDIFLEFVPEQVFVEQFADFDSSAEDLIAIAWPDAAAGGADFGPLFLCSFDAGIKHPVVGHDQVGILADHKPFRCDRQAVVLKFLHLVQENARIQDHSVADHAFFVFIQDPGRNEMEDILFALNHQGMSGIIATLKSYNIIRMPCQQVNDFAFAFITPLGPNNNYICHDFLLIVKSACRIVFARLIAAAWFSFCKISQRKDSQRVGKSQ